MKKYLILALILSSPAWAADYPRDITLSWTNASTYVDNTLIEAGDLTEVRIDCFRQGDGSLTFSTNVPVTGVGLPQTETFAQLIPQPGTYLCYGYSVMYEGTESDASNEARQKFIGKPLPPQVFR